MKQVTNLKSKIASLLGVFTEVVFFWDIDFHGLFDVDFDPYISSIVRFMLESAAKLVLFVSVAEANYSPAPILTSSLLHLSSLHLLY